MWGRWPRRHTATMEERAQFRWNTNRGCETRNRGVVLDLFEPPRKVSLPRPSAVALRRPASEPRHFVVPDPLARRSTCLANTWPNSCSERWRASTHTATSFPPNCAAWLRNWAPPPAACRCPSWDPHAALAVMDRRHRYRRALGVDLGVHLGDECRRPVHLRGDVNDYVAGRATIPASSGSSPRCRCRRRQARWRARPGLDTLGANGVVLLANHQGVYLGDKRFDPVFDELRRRGMASLRAPIILPSIEPVEVPPFMADFLLDGTRRDQPPRAQRHRRALPDVKILLSHAGGFVPYAAYRIALAVRTTTTCSTVCRSCSATTSTSRCPRPDRAPEPARLHRSTITFGSGLAYAPDTAVAAMTGMYESAIDSRRGHECVLLVEEGRRPEQPETSTNP